MVFVTWGAICWLPDIARWAEIVARMLAPGGFLYLLEGHPYAHVLEQTAADDVVWVDLYYSPFRNASRKNVKDFYQNPTGRFMLEDTSIE